ncbi:MAG: hypothetical protein HY835_11935 [Anaerolineae bacterium]|nr:hypothetical protein [Anaerolineae bacterium]
MKANLLAGSYGSFRMIDFDVTPLGFRYYEYLQQKIGNSEKRVEISMHEYLDAENFQARYPNAFQKWAQAEVLLWGEDSQAHLTTIGHLCREATLDFFTSLMENSHLPISCKGSNSTISNLRTVINSQAGNLGSAESQFLEALVAYWGGLSDLIQRQEHGAQKEGKPLVWEDARRIIFQTINVMYEVDRSLVK